jgi:branched-subunit amino acid ABC-type transport system permease component
MSPMIDFMQNTIDGVMIGSSYALLALGFTLIFGVMRRLNLSYGPSIMIGAYLGTLVHVQFSAGPLAVVALTVIGAVIAGIYVERLCFAPMAAAGAGIASMVSSFAIWMQLEQAAILVLPRHTYPFPPLSTGAPLSLGPFVLRLDHLIMLACALTLAAGVQLLLYRSRFGLALRAIINSPTAAHLVGIDVRTSIVAAFALASAVGGVAGYLVLATDQQVTPMFGMWATIKGLIAMMIGGLGSIPGAVVGGLVLGIVEAHSQWHFGPQMRDLFAYLLLFACLVLRPGGLLGEAPLREPAPGPLGGA